MRTWLIRQISSLSRESVIRRALTVISPRIAEWLNDDVPALRSNPLAMFFYNFRALAYGAALAYIVGLLVLGFGLPSLVLRQTGLLLAVTWLIAVLLTAALHRSFVNQLRNSGPPPTRAELPRR